jgi:hypothetical protein
MRLLLMVDYGHPELSRIFMSQKQIISTWVHGEEVAWQSRGVQQKIAHTCRSSEIQKYQILDMSIHKRPYISSSLYCMEGGKNPSVGF